MPCLGEDFSLLSPPAGLFLLDACSLLVSLWRFVTDTPGPTPIRVSDCRGHKESNRLMRREAPALEVLVLRADGFCCKGGSGPGPTQESL